MKKNRDDFSPKTKRALALRVGHICSNPDCEEHTSGPTVVEDDYSNSGVAAHICAAAPGGPRYDPLMSAEQRAGAGNGIWLCAGCSIKIDDDPARYPPDELWKWKVDAEQRAKRRQGQPLLTQTTVQKQLQSIFSASPGQSSRDALTNAVTAVGLHLEALDPRFKVTVAQEGASTRYRLSAQEPVDLSFNFEPVNPELARLDLLRFSEHGGSGHVEVSKLSIAGSPLISELVGEVSGLLLLESERRSASLRLWLKAADGAESDLFTMDGELTWGSQSHTVEANAFDGVFGVKISLPNAPRPESFYEITFSFDPQAWGGRNIKRLSAIEQLWTLFGGVLEDSRLWAEAFVGETTIWSVDITPSDLIYVGGQQAILDYARYARVLADRLNLSLTFEPNQAFSMDDLMLLAQVSEIARGEYCGTITSDIQAVVEWDPKALENKALEGADVALRFEERDGKRVQIYGQDVAVPPVCVEVDVVFPKIMAGGSQRVSLRPMPGAIARYRFLDGKAARRMSEAEGA
ncbi:MAG: hypothetical protein E6Q67_01745 [Roseateles sp.]|nr:MAG: hypothetical protein E6Q67_01745 [Roseateles sp.]